MVGLFAAPPTPPSLQGAAFAYVTTANVQSQIIAAPGAGLSIYILNIAAGTTIQAGNAVHFRPNGGADIFSPRPDLVCDHTMTAPLPGIKLPANTSFVIVSDLAVANQIISGGVVYYIAP